MAETKFKPRGFKLIKLLDGRIFKQEDVIIELKVNSLGYVYTPKPGSKEHSQEGK